MYFKLVPPLHDCDQSQSESEASFCQLFKPRRPQERRRSRHQPRRSTLDERSSGASGANASAALHSCHAAGREDDNEEPSVHRRPAGRRVPRRGSSRPAHRHGPRPTGAAREGLLGPLVLRERLGERARRRDDRRHGPGRPRRLLRRQAGTASLPGFDGRPGAGPLPNARRRIRRRRGGGLDDRRRRGTNCSSG